MNKLYENLEKKIIVVDDVLPEELCNSILERYSNKEEVDRVNKTAWMSDIISQTGMVLINDIDYDITKDIASSIMECSDFFEGQPKILGNDVNEHCNSIKEYGYNMMFYRWTSLSYIPVHTDLGIFNAATIYMNKDYDIREGGVYMYRINKEDAWTGIEPKFNRMVALQGDVEHWSTPVTSDRDRMSIQMFSDIAEGY
jgi:hypothetical protein